MPLKKRKPRKASKRRVIKKRAQKKQAKRRPLKRTAKKAAIKKKPIKPAKPKEKVIGLVTHYFPHVQAAVIKLKAPLSVGEAIKIKGHTTDFTQTISSMQLNHVPINEAKKGMEIGVGVVSRVRQHDVVTKA